MVDHQHGSMNIRDQEKTFSGFVRFVTYAVIAIICVLVFLALVNA
ncbi:aa3-type cytochrome c oxidase subunit IV [Thioclava atlantica]|uniref:Aa3-type cytochrome c oxidase subunit IV n=1 Tax=Thioclava atlantica TaxID=1317124 RepID=A0A085TXT8_9RHOB|nr:aa3-type cytochrome c oxidase subunit IV [Thioclava atlantica]KFE35535.1 Aa3-type cytochrome c oxidase subunit IV [Thioclava atlantica]